MGCNVAQSYYNTLAIKATASKSVFDTSQVTMHMQCIL